MNRYSLRAMGVGDILDTTFSLYRESFLLFIGITAALYIPYGAVDLLIRRADPKAGGLSELIRLLLIDPLATGALTFAVAERYLGRRAGIKEALSAVRYTSILFASILVGLVVGGLIQVVSLIGMALMRGGAAVVGVPLVIAMVPAVIYLTVRWNFYPQAIMIERYRAVGSLGRSWGLVGGFWWRVFGIIFIASLISLAPLLVIGAALELVTMRYSPGGWMVPSIAVTVLSILFMPIYRIAQTLLYFDLRVRKEAFDLELMAQSLGEPTERIG